MHQFRTTLAAVAAATTLLLAPVTSYHGAGWPATQEETPAAVREPITVICVRHAEKGAEGRDPELTAAGAARAEALARSLGHAGVTHLFASEFKRTQMTLAPLSAATGVEVVVVAARDGAAQVDALLALPGGSVAVVAAHSNTTPGIVAALGGEIDELEVDERYGPMLSEDEFDRMFVVTVLAAGEGQNVVSTVELRYGD